jgi:hypothetical protein
MVKAKRSKTKQAHGPKPAREQSHSAGANKRITAQNRKLLGKHYANKYGVGG